MPSPRHSNDSRALITSLFVIEGEKLDPEECTSFIGIQPTSSDPRAVVTGKYEDGRPYVRKPFWCVKLYQQSGDDIDDELGRLLDMLWPHREKIVRFLEGTSFDAAFGTNVTIYEDRPLYRLRPETLKKLSYFNVEYTIDIHDLTAE